MVKEGYYKEYYKKNKDVLCARSREFLKSNKASQRFYCVHCEVSCHHIKDLQKHYGTKKHQKNENLSLLSVIGDIDISIFDKIIC